MNVVASSIGDVIVLGSINVDHSIYVNAFRRPGQAIRAESGAKGFGGKGANQAVTASLHGAWVRWVGSVGADEGAGFIRSRLERFGIDDRHLIDSDDASSGAACITALGSEGAEAATGDGVWHITSPAPRAVVDSTGVGDAFVGALVGRLCGGTGLREVVHWAVAAGSAAAARSDATDSHVEVAVLVSDTEPTGKTA